MTFQSAVRYDQGSGIPGEKAYDGPSRAEPGILLAALAVGLVATESTTAPGFWSPGNVGGGRQALLTTPKQYASVGTSAGGTLAPTLVLPANTEAEFSTMGQFFANVSNADAMPGHLVYFNNTTGVLVTAAVGAAAPAASTQLVGAVVAPLPGGNRETPKVAGLVVITMNGSLPQGAHA